MWGAIAGAAISLIGGKLLNKGNDAAARRGSDAAAHAAGVQADIAQDQWDTYKKTYQPLELSYVNEAQNFDTEANRELAAGDASATVASQFGKARDRLGRTVGVDPSSAAYTSAIAGLDMNQAAVDAVSQNAARTRVKDTAWARKTDALSLGKGLPSQASAGLSMAGNANANLSATASNRANATGSAFGALVSNGLDAWNNRPQSPTRSDYTHTSGGNYDVSPLQVKTVSDLDLSFQMPNTGG